jgi:hypothetical protein
MASTISKTVKNQLFIVFHQMRPQQRNTGYNPGLFFCASASKNFSTASKSSNKKFDTSPLWTTWSIWLCRGMICLHTPVFIFET